MKESIHKASEEQLERVHIDAIYRNSYKDVLELSDYDYLLVPLDSVERIIRENGLSSDGCDGICIKEDAPILFAKKGQTL